MRGAQWMLFSTPHRVRHMSACCSCNVGTQLICNSELILLLGLQVDKNDFEGSPCTSNAAVAVFIMLLIYSIGTTGLLFSRW